MGSRETAQLTLAVDAVTAEAARRLRHEGADFVLLKGPSIAQWLYPGESRPYGDTDVLVPEHDLPRVRRVAAAMGFRERPAVILAGDRPWHAITFDRDDGRMLDVHLTLNGLEAPPAEVWAKLSTTTGTVDVFGEPIPTLDEPALVLHIALHAAQHGDEERPLEDLRRAVEQGSSAAWAEAARLAASLGGQPRFAAGLERIPRGADLAARLGLPPLSLADALERDGYPGAGWLAWAARQPPRSTLRLVVRKAFPPPDFMREYEPLAARGLGGLVVAYPARWLRLAFEVARTGRAAFSRDGRKTPDRASR